MLRDRERAEKANQKAEAQAVREQRERHIQQQQADAAQLTGAVEARVAELDTILVNGLAQPGVFSFDQLRHTYHPRPFVPDQTLATPGPAPQWDQFAPPSPTGMGRLFKGGYERAVAEARS